MNKKFLTYKELAHKLNSKGIKFEDENYDLLIRHGYFNLVNGYKNPFVEKHDENKKHKYIDGVTVTDLLLVKEFDSKLRQLFLKAITRVEEEVRTVFTQTFTFENNEDPFAWKDTNSYDLGDINKGNKLVSELVEEITNSKKTYVQHSISNNEDAPTWIVFKCIFFSKLNYIIRNSKRECKRVLCDVYNLPTTKGFNSLYSSLYWLKEIRNACAHNERIYDICSDDKNNRNKALFITFGLPKSYTRNVDKLRLIDGVVMLKYYLEPNEFRELVIKLQECFIKLKEKISINSYDHIRVRSGIKNLDVLVKLIENPFKNSYQILYDI